jgi:uncharacterized membrane protein YraQ (UPF0718 family)
MTAIAHTVWQGLANALLMAWQVGWALVLGFALSAVVQTWVGAERVQRTLGGSGPRSLALASGLGAASSSCSYAAITIARSLFTKGASASSALAFQFASTNLVIELGAVMWVLIGWQFTLAQLLGGLMLIAIMALLTRRFISPRQEDAARRHALAAAGEPGDGASGHGGHHSCCASAGTAGTRAASASTGERPSTRERLGSIGAWSDVADSFRHDVTMLWKELAIGFLLAGFVGLLGDGFLGDLFLRGAPAWLRLIENAFVGPLIAILSFVCSVGNVPIAAVLWSGGIGFGGVIAFVFADLLVLPILLIYRKFYGRAFAVRIAALMLVAIVIAAVLVDLLFAGTGLIPHVRPSRTEIFGRVTLGYTFAANVLAAAGACALLGLSARRAGRMRRMRSSAAPSPSI